MKGVEKKQTAGDAVAAQFIDDRGAWAFAFEDNLHDAVEAGAVHVHQKLDELLARCFLRAVRHLIKVCDQLSELSNLFLKFASGSHTPPF
jgi:hypothetical protein